MTDLFAPLPDKHYSVIYMDPPWDYRGCNQHANWKGTTGSADTHYPTVKLDDLKTLDIPSIADDDCLLYMWTSSPHLPEAIELGTHWGFEYKTVSHCWNKLAVNPGNYTMSQVELCLVFKKGKIPQPRGSRNERQYVQSKRREHSRKPDEVRDSIQRMHPEQNAIEVFSRRPSDNYWDVYGNQTGECIDEEGWFT